MLGISHIAEDGTLLVRDNLVFAMFAQAPLADVASGFRQAAERWLREIPQDTLSWALAGASAEELKPIGPSTISRCLSRLKDGAAPRGDMTYFMLQGPEEDNPAFRFELFAQHTLGTTARGIPNSSFIEIRFPSDYPDMTGPDALVRLVTEIASTIPFDSGYLSPAVSWSYESDLYLASRIICPLGLRYPGLDISFNRSTCYKIDKRCRGPYWITFLGKDLVSTLGGITALQASLPLPITVQPVGEGVMIRAGDKPETGDVNRNDKAPLLRTIAALLEPVTFLGDTTIKSYLFNNDDEKFERWDRRLLD